METFFVYALVFLVVYGLLLLLLRIDWTPGRYKVVFREGPEIGIKVKGYSGWLTFDDKQIRIVGEREFILPLESVLKVEIFRLYGLGRMIRITHPQGILFVTVVRFCIAGRFATVDFFKTKRLLTQISSQIGSNSPEC